ncbi:hypothetical protein [Paraburkholderia tagetis]|uniref:Uncharacterized protein n=1 Tax=Paraburkholderia tagetis TaxID=2913261 RepID=A0A9X1RPH5_9BURK|nr:hypothetical protein [Paraburkholderia tagetis]MCG5073919.1 hypothetical protein [Paraburkholderia tagetis]
MNRRVFLHVAGGALAAAWAASAAKVTTRRWPPGALQGAGQEPVQAPMQTTQQTTRQTSMQNPVCMAVYDPTLARGRALAREAARMGVSAFALGAQFGDDIGMLWHAQLARRLETGTEGSAVAHYMLCAVRASDRFVLERLTAPRGCIVLDGLDMLDAQQT